MEKNEYIKSLYKDNLSYKERRFLIDNAKMDLLYELNKKKINESTMYRLLWHLEKKENAEIRNLLFYLLFNYKNSVLKNILSNYDIKIKY